jgi:ATP-dependent Clp protease ATP-binding subunit ClpB
MADEFGLRIDDLRARLADQELGLSLDDAALRTLAEKGFDPVYGARPVKRAIQRELETPIARKIIAGDYLPGATITVSGGKGGLTIA